MSSEEGDRLALACRAPIAPEQGAAIRGPVVGLPALQLGTWEAVIAVRARGVEGVFLAGGKAPDLEVGRGPGGHGIPARHCDPRFVIELLS